MSGNADPCRTFVGVDGRRVNAAARVEDPPIAAFLADQADPINLHALPSHIWIRLHDREEIMKRLRISLTEHCNESCFFCHNEGQGDIRRRPGRALSSDHLQAATRVAVMEGVDRVKLTGGEPLLFRSGRDDVVSLVSELATLRKEGWTFDLSLTTNGSLLSDYAEGLAQAGLDRVTVSLTTLNPTTFRTLISRNDSLLPRTIAGLQAAQAVGLTPLKINTVLYHSVQRSIGNLDELRDLVRVATDHGVAELRFFTLLWHEAFAEFDEFYHFFSTEMRESLVALLDGCDVVEPEQTVDLLSRLAHTFAHRLYPKVEFGVDLGRTKLGFEAMKYGRVVGRKELQEGPYAMRLATDGGLRATLNGAASYDLIRGIRDSLPLSELRRRYRRAQEGLP